MRADGPACSSDSSGCAAGHARRECRLVSRQHRAWHRRLVRRSALARARAVRTALAKHEPPDGRRLLGVADSARLRQHQLRHRRRRDLHPFATLNRFERALDWLREFEPQCARSWKRTPADLEDFLALQHFAHGCSRVFSPDRWALVGEAGVFTDPFYSPGSDFIAMGNDYAADLISPRRTRRRHRRAREPFNTTYLRLFDAFIRLYDGQYPIMGNAQVMTAKVAWDNACYWAITALLFFQRRLSPAGVHRVDRAADAPLLRPARPHAAVLQCLERRSTPADYGAGFTSVVDVEFLRRLQADLGEPPMDDAALRARLDDQFRAARAFRAHAGRRSPRQDRGAHPDLARYLAGSAGSSRWWKSALCGSAKRLPQFALRIPPEGGLRPSRL